MIDPRELRIGNLINWKNTGNVVVDADDFYELHYDSTYFNVAEPIPLTEQHLIDFGAIQKYGSYNEYYLHKMKFDFSTNGICRFHWSGKVTYLDYVHEFQNLVKSLTGKELTKQ